MSEAPDDYRRALDAACREWETLAAERAAVERRLVDLQRTIVTLTRLCGLTPTVPLGLADGCRLVLRRQGERALSGRDMREELEAVGVDLSQLSNPLASIHVTLKRLVAAGEARFIPGGRGARPLYAAAHPAGAGLAVGGRRGVVPPFGTPSRPGGAKRRRRKP